MSKVSYTSLPSTPIAFGGFPMDPLASSASCFILATNLRR